MLDQLKKDIEIQLGKKIAYQKDCKLLSNSILESSGDYLSTATLRRFFGFLITNSNPSRVTLDILSRYVGYNDWNQYVTKNSKNKNASKSLESWAKINDRVKKISTDSINKIKSKCTIDFSLSIPRLSVDELIDSFIESSYAATAIVGPSGFGKSTILAKWYINKIKKSNRKNDIILYTSFRLLQKHSNQKIASDEFIGKIDSILGLTRGESIRDSLLNQKGANLPKFIIVIDALENENLESSKFDQLYLSINEYLKDIAKNSTIKLILVMRYSSWKHFGSYIELDSNWFNTSRSCFNQYYANIPPFETDEIQKVLDNTINHKYALRVHVEELGKQLQDLLSYPYFLQLYTEIFQPEEDNIYNDQINLIREILNRQIYHSPFAEEKTDIITKIIELSNFGKNPLGAKKNDLKAVYPINLKNAGYYYSAYEELKKAGIVNEERHTANYGGTKSYITISHKQLFNQLIIEYFIQKQGKFTFQLFENLEEFFQNHELLAPLIILAYQIAYKEREIEPLKDFFSLKSETISSVFNYPTIQLTLRKDEYLRKIIIPEYSKNSLAREILFKTNPDLNFLVKNYGNTIRYNIENKTYDNNELKTANILLAYQGLLKLDKENIEKYIALIKNYNSTSGFNPSFLGLWYSCMNLFESLINGNVFNKYLTDATEIITNDTYKEAAFENAFFPSVVLSNQQLFSDPIKRYFRGSDAKPKNDIQLVYKYMYDVIVEKKFDDHILNDIDIRLRNLNPIDNLIAKILELVIKASHYLNKKDLGRSYENLRYAIELSNYYEYTLVEVKLLKILAANLRRFGEIKKANECQLIIDGIIMKSHISEERL